MSQQSTKGTILDALTTFDQLPDSASVREPVVEAVFCCSKSTVNRMEKSGILKANKHTKGIKTYNVGHIRMILGGSQQ